MATPKMPDKYVGGYLTENEFNKTIPRKWTQKECEWCLELKNQGYSIEDIAESIGRETTSVSIKMKRLGKKCGTYNSSHLKRKYELNDDFYNFLLPQNVLDVYAGQKHYWKDKCLCTSNDIDIKIEADYHMEALKFVCQEYLEGNQYDLVDLDPFGSAYDCFDLAIKIAKKGIIITYGELGHQRFKRLDYVRNIYGINKLEDFTLDNLIFKTQEIAAHNHKRLRVYSQGEWQNIARVYYIIEPLKITEQWGGE